ncbi:ABC transporter ATP-binding protein [Ralstonia pickettii]|nr:ABC transporter ATP-binding protein [Ralstonia pickettii]
MNIVKCADLTKTVIGKNTLNKLNLTIEEDKITGLIGRNGAGKTTLMKVLAGYWRETSGRIEVFSEHPFNNLLVSANSIYIDDLMTFNHNLTLEDILKEADSSYPNWDKVLAERLFKYFSFDPKSKHHSLSKGKKSTFNIIIGLASRCKLTMFDEPTTGMDASVRKDFYRALLKDYLTHPRSILISSHHLEEIEDVLEDVILIDNGKVHLHESMDDLKEYAQGITGRTEVLRPLLANQEIIYQTQVGENSTYAVVKADNAVIEKAEQFGMMISAVTPNDLCIYLTSKEKGGIDDVFK